MALASLTVFVSSASCLQRVAEPPPGPVAKPFTKENRTGPAASIPGVPPGAAAFAIRLEAEVALENGPVVYRIRLTNLAPEPRDCLRHTHFETVRLSQTSNWIAKPSPDVWAMSISGRYGPFHEHVAPGKSATTLIAVQDGFQRIPAGRVHVDFEWDAVGPVCRSWYATKRSWGSSDFDERAENREPVRGRQVVAVRPATPENIARAKEKLEQYLRETAAGTRPPREIVQCFAGSRHPEFVPLIIRAVQLCDGCDYPKLIDTLYDSYPDPTTGFEFLFPLLESGDPAGIKLLDYWDLEAFHHLVHQRQVAARDDLSALQVWNYSRVHPNSRLTLGQHARIMAVNNVWVRAAYWHDFPELCSLEWVLCLYEDLKRTLLPPDEGAVRDICRRLVDNRFAVRERATIDAVKTDERVVPALREYLRQHPSAEFGQRVDSIAQHFRRQPLPPLAARVIERAMYGGKAQGELIFEALSGPPGSCRLADHVRDKRPEQQRRRQEELKRQRELDRLQPGK